MPRAAGNWENMRRSKGEIMRSYLTFAIAQLIASSAFGAQYSPAPTNDVQKQMNVVVDQQPSTGKRDLTIQLVVPNAPTAPISNNYVYYTIYTQIMTNPSNTVELVRNDVNWTQGQPVKVTVSVAESHYSDGSAVYLCMGNQQGCVPTQNLIGAAPAPQ
jgi:hypothetical protein